MPGQKIKYAICRYGIYSGAINEDFKEINNSNQNLSYLGYWPLMLLSFRNC